MRAVGPAESRIAHLFESASRSHGVFTWDQWLAAELSGSLLRRMTTSGELERLHPTVYRVVASPETWRQRAFAAVVSVPGLALLSHRAAAALWSLDGAVGRTIDISMPRARRVRRRACVVHESTLLPATAPLAIDSIPVTGIEQTIVDVARYVPAERLEDFVESAVRQQLTSYDRIEAHRLRFPGPGRKGHGTLGDILGPRLGAARPTGSRFELLAERMIAELGLPLPDRQVPVDAGGARFFLDFGWPDRMVGLEWDGSRYHSTTAQREYDRWRQNLIQLEGWMVLRYTKSALRSRRADCGCEIARALATRPPRLCVPESRIRR